MSRRSVDERNWEAHGLDCAVLRVKTMGGEGHRCGYVRVPEDHPWHGLAYCDEAPGEPADYENRSTEDAGMGGALAMLAGNVDEWAKRIEGHVAVHGGLTFSGELVGHDGWWFGFDCAHLDDTPDRWTLEAVAAETERMAEQIAAVEQP